MLIIIYGNLGTGKSSLGKMLSEKKGFELIQFDKEMWKFKDKIYTKEDDFLLEKKEILKVYENMHKLAKNMLKQSKTVILDSLYLKQQREDAKEIAKQTNNKWIIVEVSCDEKEIRKRLTKRKKEDVKTPGFKLYLEYKNLLEKEPNCIKINTSSKNIEESYEELIKKIQK